jgi:hypothetical protein
LPTELSSTGEPFLEITFTAQKGAQLNRHPRPLFCVHGGNGLSVDCSRHECAVRKQAQDLLEMDTLPQQCRQIAKFGKAVRLRDCSSVRPSGAQGG